MMDYVIFGSAALLFISALMIVYRAAKGPTALDRMVCVDMLTSIVIGGFALLAAATRRVDLLPVFISLSIIGFIGSTTLARFSAPLTAQTRKELAKKVIKRREISELNVARENLQNSAGKQLAESTPSACEKRGEF